MTIKQILQDTARKMASIDVPVFLKEQIGDPLFECLGAIQVCANAIQDEQENPEKAMAEEKEPSQESIKEVISDGE